MSIQSVAAASAAMAEAEAIHAARLAELKTEMVEAKLSGVPTAAIARAAGVSRQTAVKWLNEGDRP